MLDSYSLFEVASRTLKSRLFAMLAHAEHQEPMVPLLARSSYEDAAILARELQMRAFREGDKSYAWDKLAELCGTAMARCDAATEARSHPLSTQVEPWCFPAGDTTSARAIRQAEETRLPC